MCELWNSECEKFLKLMEWLTVRSVCVLYASLYIHDLTIVKPLIYFIKVCVWLINASTWLYKPREYMTQLKFLIMDRAQICT